MWIIEDWKSYKPTLTDLHIPSREVSQIDGMAFCWTCKFLNFTGLNHPAVLSKALCNARALQKNSLFNISDILGHGSVFWGLARS